jgi:hypothetical protein
MPDDSDCSNHPDVTGNGNESDSGSGPSAGTWTFAAQAHYDPSDARELTTVVISVVAEAEGVPLTAIRSPPLHEVIDIIDVENALFGTEEVSRSDSVSITEFEYRGFKVSIESDGWVIACRRADASCSR